MIWKSALIAVAAAALATPASAEGPDDGKGRYSLSPVDGGVLRLDKETGAVALCAKKGQFWACEAVEDSSKSGGALTKLETENKELRDRISVLEDQAAGTAGPPAPKAQLPTEEEVDKALDYVERVFKNFRDRIRKYEDAPPPVESAPVEPGKGGSAL